MKSLEERFWSKVRKTEECWWWEGAVTEKGYGFLDSGGRKGKYRTAAHRLVCELAGLDIKDRVVRHECNNKTCVRIIKGHVQVGTQKQNMVDRERAGNTRRGSRAGILSKELANEILLLWNTNKYSTRMLGRKFNVSKSTIHGLVAGKTGYANELGIVPLKRSRSESTSGQFNGSYKHGSYVRRVRRTIEN